MAKQVKNVQPVVDDQKSKFGVYPATDAHLSEAAQALDQHFSKAITDLANWVLSEFEKTADKATLASVWRSSETLFATKSSVQDVIQALDLLASKDEVAGVKTILSQLVSMLDQYSTKTETQSAISYLSNQSENSRLYKTDVTITSADLLTLNATPKLLIPSAGAGKTIEIKRVELFLDFATAAYATPRDLSVAYETSGQILLVDGASWLDSASDKRRCAHPGDIHNVGENEAVTLSAVGGELTVGDSPLKARIDYRIVDVLV